MAFFVNDFMGIAYSCFPLKVNYEELCKNTETSLTKAQGIIEAKLSTAISVQDILKKQKIEALQKKNRNLLRTFLLKEHANNTMLTRLEKMNETIVKMQMDFMSIKTNRDIILALTQAAEDMSKLTKNVKLDKSVEILEEADTKMAAINDQIDDIYETLSMGMPVIDEDELKEELDKLEDEYDMKDAQKIKNTSSTGAPTVTVSKQTPAKEAVYN